MNGGIQTYAQLLRVLLLLLQLVRVLLLLLLLLPTDSTLLAVSFFNL